MGRHGRSAAGPAPVPEPDGGAGRRRGRGRRLGGPVRTGLLGASAAMAVGAVAVTSGLIPGGGGFDVGAGAIGSEHVRPADVPSGLHEQGGHSASPTPSDSATGGSADVAPKASGTRSAEPSKTHAATPDRPKATPSPRKTRTAGDTKTSAGTKAPSTKAPAPATSTPHVVKAPASPTGASTVAAQVLALVNQERAKVGCSALKDDGSLDSLAQNFSDEMAQRGFFDHTDPDGKTPWDRADAAGVRQLGGENIARGQADAQAVMDAWMHSEGHRANILNCDYTRLGVGVHYGAGGPWWTQDFGF
ncbi:CAP domain-containing protein [Streptomyces montanisoli]|uniref:CAP domain-containing protein n=1 Tax=Streptomyces montanisoli TaxID=2798581 RepID=A0A940MLY4_9ACTN|nr:CAP domain-containing protein [Streptomyces montanisoli]MBP0461851.1 CAP domain-containing protein [Streptomyces montanisoli]